MITIPRFAKKADLFKFLVENKDTLIAEKTMQVKNSDGIAFSQVIFEADGKTMANKANGPVADLESKSSLFVQPVINTSNWLDTFLDVHIPGLWDKSLKENKRIKHLQEHQMAFDKIISDGANLKAYTKDLTWKELGFNIQGKTEALIFDSNIVKTRNPFMFDQYGKGYVDNHSVGMRYIKLVMCVNDENYGAEFEAWDKYYSEIVNPDMADKYGYFWAVTEAKCLEGSAVPIGANVMTPTLNNNMGKSEPVTHSHNQPDNSTGKIDYGKLAKAF